MGYLTIVRRHAAVMVLIAVATALAAAFGSLLQDTKYEASAAVQVHQVDSPFRSSGGTKSDLTRALQTQMDLIAGDAVRARVAKQLGTAPHVAVGPRGQADEIAIRASAPTAAAAAEIANTYARAYIAELADRAAAASKTALETYQTNADQLQKQIDSVEAEQAISTGAEAARLRLQHDVLVAQLKALAVDSVVGPTNAPAPLGATMVEAARAPDSPAQPRPVRNGILGLLAGVIAGSSRRL